MSMLSLFFTDHWVTYAIILGCFMLILRLLKFFGEQEKTSRRVRFREPVQEEPPEAF